MNNDATNILLKTEMKTKICTKCRKEKILDDFHKSIKGDKYGRKSVCKKCRSEPGQLRMVLIFKMIVSIMIYINRYGLRLIADCRNKYIIRDINLRLCTCCKKLYKKPWSNSFYREPTMHDGYKSNCNTCAKKKHKIFYYNNHEYNLKRVKNYRKINIIEIKEKVKSKYHKDKLDPNFTPLHNQQVMNWTRKNSFRINKKKRDRFKNDEEYRNHILKRNKKYRDTNQLSITTNQFFSRNGLSIKYLLSIDEGRELISLKRDLILLRREIKERG